YLAAVMDLYSRMIVGYAMDTRMTKELVLNALRMARFKRKPKPGLIHHSDRGYRLMSASPCWWIANISGARIDASADCYARPDSSPVRPA
ncbi:MAG: DDE-type integrase/transposase/recombinase, partial [Rhodocyclaceae bacterium]|nr:DDE-type integrase/transposase/recombinase [Rhodocyclaceae bacterium]